MNNNQTNELTARYSMRNKNVLVKLFSQDTVLNNGIAITETRGKKEIACGTVLEAEVGLKIPERALCWFPMYASLPIKLEDQVLYIVNYADIVMVEKTE